MNPDNINNEEYLDALVANDCTLTKQERYVAYAAISDPKRLFPGSFVSKDYYWEGNDDGA